MSELEARIARLEQALADTQAHLFGDWSPAGYPLLPPRSAITADHPAQMARFLATGWWDVEPWGVWGRDDRHAIRFHLKGYDGGYADIVLVVQAFIPEGLDRRELRLTANGLFLGLHELRSTPRTIKLRIPPAAIEAGDVILYFNCSPLPLPASPVMGEDDRVLGVGLISVGAP